MGHRTKNPHCSTGTNQPTSPLGYSFHHNHNSRQIKAAFLKRQYSTRYFVNAMGPQRIIPSSTGTAESPTNSMDHHCEESSASDSSSQGDHNTMNGAGSVPTACNSSVNSDDTQHDASEDDNLEGSRHIPTSASVLASIANSSHITSESELARIQQLEKKRTALRNQRFSLEQRLYEFCGKHAESGPVDDPCQMVTEWHWKDTTTGLRVIYSGPLNELNQPHGSNGELKFSDGQVYVGDVRLGLRAGQGRNTWADGQQYVGEWKANSRNGKGTHVWPDGRKVSGQWQDGHLDGKVYFSWPNGATYDGLVRKGKKNGRGACHT